MKHYPDCPQRIGSTALAIIHRRGWNDFHPETLISLDEVELAEHEGEVFVIQNGQTLAPLGSVDALREIPVGTFEAPVHHGDTHIHPMRLNQEAQVRYLVVEPADDGPPNALRIVFGFNLPMSAHETLWREWLGTRGVEAGAVTLSEDALGPDFGPMEF